MSEEMLPCPFCGSEAVLHHDYYKECAYWIQCDACRVGTLAHLGKEYVIRAWNTRAEKVCRWKNSARAKIGWPDYEEWESECGTTFAPVNQVPGDANFSYCPNCGGKIECGSPNDTADEYATVTVMGETLELLRALQDADDTTPDKVIEFALNVYDAERVG